MEEYKKIFDRLDRYERYEKTKKEVLGTLIGIGVVLGISFGTLGIVYLVHQVTHLSMDLVFFTVYIGGVLLLLCYSIGLYFRG